MIHVFLRQELERLGLKAAAAAKLAGEPDSQGLRDVLGGRKRLSADLLAALAPSGVDVVYVLTGQRSAPVSPTDPGEQVLLQAYRAAPVAQRTAMLGAVVGIGQGAAVPQAMVSHGAGAVQIGNVSGGKIRMGKSKAAGAPE